MPTIVQVPLVEILVPGLLCLVALGQTLCLPAFGSWGAKADDLPREPITLPYRWPELQTNTGAEETHNLSITPAPSPGLYQES